MCIKDEKIIKNKFYALIIIENIYFFICVTNVSETLLAASQKMCGSFICNQIQTLLCCYAVNRYVRYYDLENQNRKKKILVHLISCECYQISEIQNIKKKIFLLEQFPISLFFVCFFFKMTNVHFRHLVTTSEIKFQINTTCNLRYSCRHCHRMNSC